MVLFSRYRDLRWSALIVFTFFLDAPFSKGQCPEKSFLEKRISYKDSSNYSSEMYLAELLDYLDKVQNCSYKNDSTHARLAKRIAKIYYLNADYLNAIKYYGQSIGIITASEMKSSVNLTDLTGAYYWLSMAYEALNMASEKMIALDSCYKAAIRIHHIDAACLRALYKWAEYFFDLGDYHRCIDYMQRCESLAKGYADVVPQAYREEFISSSLLWQVKALLELQEYEKAETLLTNRIEECKNAGQINNLGTIFSQFAELQMRKGNYDKALIYYKMSFRNDQQVGHDFNCKQTMKDIGYNVYFSHFNDFEKALSYYNRALTFINKDKVLREADSFESLSIYTNMANGYVQKGNFDFAFKYFQLAFDQIKTGANEDYILRSSQQEFIKYKKIHYLTSLEIDKGDAFHSLYERNGQKDNLQKAILVYKKTDQLLDRIKMEQSELQSKLFWRSDSRRLYEHAIEACYLSGDIDNAFYFFEKSRAVLLQDQLNKQRWLGAGDIMKQAQLNKRILQLERELTSSDRSPKNYSDLQNELFSTKQERENTNELIKATNPLYFQNFMSNDSITIQNVKEKVLDDHQALVELFAGDSAVYLLVVAPQKSWLKKINKVTFDNLTRTCITRISDEYTLNRNFESFVSISQQLQQLLFDDINLPAGRIIISPDGKYFPFEALVTKNQPVTYFVENHAVSYTYSARYLLNNFSVNSSAGSNTFMGIAPVRYSNGLPALSGSDQSLQKIKGYFSDVNNLIGNKASKNNFLREYYKYKIIQLYTHAMDGGATGEPTIYFSDSILSMSDLFYENKPATSLIVLSACETAEGKLYNGEGVFSFNRQFAALGIPSSVSNLWQVNDQSSYQLTELFYKYVAKGTPLDVALQEAKKEFRKIVSSKEKDLPYYWAAPILVGQTNKISLPKPFPWTWVALVSSLLILCVWGLGRWRKRRG